MVVFWLFFKIDLCSATSIERSRRDLLNDVAELSSTLKMTINDVAEPSSTLKNNQRTYYSRLASHLEQVKNSLKRAFCFYCMRWKYRLRKLQCPFNYNGHIQLKFICETRGWSVFLKKKEVGAQI